MLRPDLIAVARNAHRLLQDAQVLAEAGRYPAALSLSILALEEVGKYFILKWPERSKAEANPRPLRSHREKQATATVFPMAKASMDVLKEVSTEFGLAGDEAAVEQFRAVYRHLKSDPCYQNLVDAIDANLLDRLTKAIEGSSGLHKKALSGALDTLKQQGFYVDVRSGAVISDPASLTEADAAFWLTCAAQAVGRLPPQEAGGGYGGKT